jgi:MFS family permease
MLFIGLIICCLGVSLMVNSLPMLYVVIVVGIVLGSSLGYNMPISVLIAKVFHERRSLAFGIFRMGPGISVTGAAGRLDNRRVGLDGGGG